MLEILNIVILLGISYLIGSIPTSIVVSKLFKGIDIREHGSGNAGGTNTYRVLGKLPAIIVVVVDILKGIFAAYVVSNWIFSDLQLSRLEMNTLKLGCGLAAVFGHIYTAFAGFKGGKGVATGVGMFIGVIVFLLGTKHYGDKTEKKGVQEGDMPFYKIVLFILLPSVIFGVIGWLLKGVTSDANLDSSIFGSDSTDAFVFACIPIIFFYGSLYFKAKAEDKRPIGALLSIFAVVILFWAVFKLNGSALNNWGDKYTDRELTGTAQQIGSKLVLTDTLTYSKDSVALYDAAFLIQKKDGKVTKVVDYPLYFRNVAKEKLPKENDKIFTWSANLSQSINPGWVIILTPLVVAFFTFLRSRKKEPSTPTKIAFGLLISALSVLVMVAAVHIGNNGSEKVSVWWLVANYGVITIGELFLSPMGLSVVSKLSPKNITALMMGGWFLSTSIGNKLSGVLASMWDTYDDKANFFWVNFCLLMFATLLMFALVKELNKVMKEKGIN